MFPAAALWLSLCLSTAAGDHPPGGASLTPFGAERAGNTEGSIPAWDGGVMAPPEDYQGSGHPHPDPYSNDQPIARINPANADDYDTLLSPGWRALLARYPATFEMPLYPTRRSHSAPRWVYDNTRNSQARLVNEGNGFEGARAGIPFPEPEQALEVYWNHVARWRGQYIEGDGIDVNSYADGQFALTRRETRVKFNFYDQALPVDSTDNRLFSLLSRITSPAQKAGNAVLVIEPIDQNIKNRSAWSWDSARRRALRAPKLAFDMSVNSADGLHTADDTDLINGSPERFEWRLLEKRELIIPYNCYALERTIADEKLLLAGHLNPDVLRYERHRVWVLEATLKKKWRHIYSRRVLYIDEDSWMAVLSENYDNQGDLWRVNVAYPVNYYELPATLPTAYVYHDLSGRRYHVKGLRNVEKGPLRTLQPVPPDGQFTPQGLRRFAR